jgi:hypothetical protein
MTIALAIKVHDGVVLAADSATTLTSQKSNGAIEITNIYNNANKVFNLHRGLPIGAMTWGLGNIGPASISSLAKDLRKELQGGRGPHLAIDTDRYAIPDVAARIHRFLYVDRYDRQFDQLPITERPRLGFLTVGYSSDEDHPRLFSHSVKSGAVEVLKERGGAMWWGHLDAISRLLNGQSIDAAGALKRLGMSALAAEELATAVTDRVATRMVQPAMPIQDAIDLARFLVSATCQYVRFSPGHATVGGPIDIATVTKHEGFKWVTRKLFFDCSLNPILEGR